MLYFWARLRKSLSISSKNHWCTHVTVDYEIALTDITDIALSQACHSEALVVVANLDLSVS